MELMVTGSVSENVAKYSAQLAALRLQTRFRGYKSYFTQGRHMWHFCALFIIYFSSSRFLYVAGCFVYARKRGMHRKKNQRI